MTNTTVTHTNTAKLLTTPAKLSDVIAKLERLLSKVLSDQLKQLNITLPQYTVLALISKQGSINNVSLAEILCMQPQSAHKIVQDLLTLAWIDKHNDPNHGRRILLQLTQAGHNQLAECHRIVDQLETKMQGDMDIHLAMLMRNQMEQMVMNLNR